MTSIREHAAQRQPAAAASTGAPRPGTEIAERDNTPRGLIEQYSGDFATVLPSHIRPETWVRVAQGALKKGKKQGQFFELEIAASNNPAAFLSALLDAARQGLEPGTEQYYLTPRKVNGRLEILGMRGYQGEIELIYRAGAVSSVIVEVVKDRDVFIWTPGRVDPQGRWQGPMERPYHEVDWFAEDRGELRGVYAYAVMRDGATSKVVVLNRADIERIKSFAQGTDSKFSPWNTSTEAMWLKSAAHQLQKWVPTSAEYLTSQARAAGTAAGAAMAERERAAIASPPLRAEVELGANPNHNGDQGVIDAEVVDTTTGEITSREPDDDPRDEAFFADLEAGR